MPHEKPVSVWRMLRSTKRPKILEVNKTPVKSFRNIEFLFQAIQHRHLSRLAELDMLLDLAPVHGLGAGGAGGVALAQVGLPDMPPAVGQPVGSKHLATVGAAIARVRLEEGFSWNTALVIFIPKGFSIKPV